MKRPKEITKLFLMELDKHMNDLKTGKAETTFELKDIAALLYIHPTHLSNTIKEELKKSPCEIYEEKLMNIAKELLLTTNLKVALLQEIATNKGCSASQLAIAWVMHKGNDILPLIGTTKQDRLKENLEAAEINLTANEIKTLDDLFPEGTFAGTRYAAPQMGMVVN
jgi:diketogulonate reductase-like aldo/keto reductase